MAYRGYCNDVEFELKKFVELGGTYFCEHKYLSDFVGLLYEKANGALAIELKRAVIREKEIGILKALAEMKERVLREDNEFISVLLDENIDKSMAFKRLHEKILLQNREKLLKEFKRKYLIINLVSYLFTGVLILLDWSSSYETCLNIAVLKDMGLQIRVLQKISSKTLKFILI